MLTVSEDVENYDYASDPLSQTVIDDRYERTQNRLLRPFSAEALMQFGGATTLSRPFNFVYKVHERPLVSLPPTEGVLLE